MKENIIENIYIPKISEKKNDSNELANLSRSEILDLIEKTPDSKNETLEGIPNEVYWPEGIDQKIVDQFEYSKEYGYKVGSVEVVDKETEKVVELDLYCNRKIMHYDKIDREQLMEDGVIQIDENGNCVDNYNYDPKLECFCYYYYLVDNNEKVISYMFLKNDSKDLLTNNPDISKNLLNYSGDMNEESESFIYIDTMLGGGGEKYKGCGTALHQTAVEHSLREGYKGKIQLGAAGFASKTSGEIPVVTSAGFHENFGYFYKDVYDKNGKLLHGGEEIHGALAESRWDEAQKWKIEHPEERMPNIKDNYRPKSDEALYAFLPEHVVLREKERMLKNQNLRVNLETLEALEEKHKAQE